MKLALIGVGMIGGSVAAALRRAGAIDRAVGFDADPKAARRGVELGVLDAAAASVEEAVREADLVVLAVPVGAMKEVMSAAAKALPAHAIVTDVGSTKLSVIEAARAALGAASSFSIRRFVPGHPIAGRELPGVEHGDAELFRGRLYICTPIGETNAEARATIEDLWRRIGASVVTMEAEEHDRVFAAVSHLPHLLAFALVARIASEPDGERKLGFAGAGFRDFTRIAASSPAMWRDVCLGNRAALSEELRGYRALLDELQRALDAGDAATLEATFELASRTRRRHARTFDAE
jgi:prephenate dehydrogenase